MRRLAVIALLLLAGCGDELVSGSFRPPFFTLTLHSIIDPNLALTLPTTLPVAILWQSDASDVGFAVEAGTIPSSSNTGVFTLDINALPPAPAVESLHGQALPGVDPSLQWTAGTLVAYLDNNHNGTLDLSDVVALDDKHDRIIGAAPVYTLFDVVGGKPAPAQYVGIVPVSAGFSIVEEPGRADPPLGSATNSTATATSPNRAARGSSASRRRSCRRRRSRSRSTPIRICSASTAPSSSARSTSPIGSSRRPIESAATRAASSARATTARSISAAGRRLAHLQRRRARVQLQKM